MKTFDQLTMLQQRKATQRMQKRIVAAYRSRNKPIPEGPMEEISREVAKRYKYYCSTDLLTEEPPLEIGPLEVWP